MAKNAALLTILVLSLCEWLSAATSIELGSYEEIAGFKATDVTCHVANSERSISIVGCTTYSLDYDNQGIVLVVDEDSLDFYELVRSGESITTNDDAEYEVLSIGMPRIQGKSVILAGASLKRPGFPMRKSLLSFDISVPHGRSTAEIIVREGGSLNVGGQTIGIESINDFRFIGDRILVNGQFTSPNPLHNAIVIDSRSNAAIWYREAFTHKIPEEFDPDFDHLIDLMHPSDLKQADFGPVFYKLANSFGFTWINALGYGWPDNQSVSYYTPTYSGLSLNVKHDLPRLIMHDTEGPPVCQHTSQQHLIGFICNIQGA